MSRKPHTCPTCEGSKTVASQRCPTCDATGVVWEPEGTQEAIEPIPGQDALDLTYRAG